MKGGHYCCDSNSIHKQLPDFCSTAVLKRARILAPAQLGAGVPWRARKVMQLLVRDLESEGRYMIFLVLLGISHLLPYRPHELSLLVWPRETRIYDAT